MFSKKSILSFFYFILGVLFFYPFLFCPFRLAYIYCSICHIKCPWGKLRWILLLFILGLNFIRNIFCSNICFCGKLQDLESKIKVKKFKLPPNIYKIRYFVLGFLILFMFLIGRSFLYVFNKELLFFLIGVIFLICFFSHRFWCLIFCPIGGLTDVFLKIKKQIFRKIKK